MQLADGTVLMHGSAPYDPKKAHDYYLRTRKLKGRQKGQQSFGPTKARTAKPSYTVKTNGRTVVLTEQELQAQKAYAAQRVGEIKMKLHKLNLALRKAVAEAKKSEHHQKHPTAADKHKKAKESAKYRDKHKQELKTKAKRSAAKSSGGSSSKGVHGTPDQISKKIDAVEQTLRTVIARQRALTSAKKTG